MTRLKSVSRYLRLKTVKTSVRGKVRKELLKLIQAEKPELVNKRPMSNGINDDVRHLLCRAVFTVENDLESKGGGHPHDPTVVALNTIRNRLYDELGINEEV